MTVLAASTMLHAEYVANRIRKLNEVVKLFAAETKLKYL